MGKSNLTLVIFSLVLLSVRLVAQENRYVVYFSDKNNTVYSIDQPSDYLSAKAIERRQKQSISITAADFPVNSNYITSIKNLGAETYFTSRWMNAVLVQATEAEIAVIEGESYVSKTEYVAPGVKLSQTPEGENLERIYNEPSNSSSINSEKQLSMLSANLMHDDQINGEGVWIAILDDGFSGANKSSAFQHTFENNKLKDVFDYISGGKNVFQYDDHGTSALSCFAAYWSPSLVGTGYNADVSLFVTEDVFTEYRIEEYNWLFAAERADSAGVDIITSSLGYYDFDDETMNYTHEDLNGDVSIISKAAKMAIERGMLVVTSAGNEGTNPWQKITMPSDVKNIISVGAIDASSNLASFSSVGPTADNRIKPEVVALGVGTTTLRDGNILKSRNGTSFAAPLIAGFAAGLWQKYPNLTNLELREVILSSSNRYSKPDNTYGYGLPNYSLAIGEVPLAVNEVIEDHIIVFPNPVKEDYIKLLFNRNNIKSNVTLKLISPSGKIVNEKVVSPKKGLLFEMSFNEFNQGVYFLMIEGESFTKKVKILRY